MYCTHSKNNNNFKRSKYLVDALALTHSALSSLEVVKHLAHSEMN